LFTVVSERLNFIKEVIKHFANFAYAFRLLLLHRFLLFKGLHKDMKELRCRSSCTLLEHLSNNTMSGLPPSCGDLKFLKTSCTPILCLGQAAIAPDFAKVGNNREMTPLLLPFT
jgi:hypothetical protein